MLQLCVSCNHKHKAEMWPHNIEHVLPNVVSVMEKNVQNGICIIIKKIKKVVY